MNQSEFLAKKNAVNKPKVPKNPKKPDRRRLIMMISIGAGILMLIFIISFSISYNKIAANRDVSKSAEELLQEKTEEIARLERELQEKDDLIAEYEKQIEELKEREEYAKKIAEEMKKLPKEQVRVIRVPSEPAPQSDVQMDLYTEPDSGESN